MSAELWCGEVHPHASGEHIAVPPHQMSIHLDISPLEQGI